MQGRQVPELEHGELVESCVLWIRLLLREAQDADPSRELIPLQVQSDGVVAMNLLPDVEDCAVRIHSGQRRFASPERHEAFRRNNPFLDSRWRPWPMAADAEGTKAPVRVLDAQNRIAVGSLVRIADVVNQSRALKIGELPTRQSRNLVGATSGRHRPVKCFPSPAAGDSVGCSTARGRDESSGTREFDL